MKEINCFYEILMCFGGLGYSFLEVVFSNVVMLGLMGDRDKGIFKI